MNDKAYLYGVILGDGFFGKRNSNDQEPSFIMLKAVDPDFVEHFQSIAEKVTGSRYSVYKSKPDRPTRNALYLCKCYAPDLVKEAKELTHSKTEIPNFIKDGTGEAQKAFLQGLMDSEGWVSCNISPMKQTHIGLYFANTSSWTTDVWHMFKGNGIDVSKMYTRKFADGRKDTYWFKINISDYVNQGLTFNILRKRRRLEFISSILRDYMRDYKGSYREPVEDIVQLPVKAGRKC